VLLIEFDGDDFNRINEISKNLLSNLKGKNLTNRAYLCLDEVEKGKFWAIRKAASPMLYKLRGKVKLLI